MKKTILALTAVFCVKGSFLLAQDNNPLVNSAEVITKAYEYTHDKKYDDAIAEYMKVPVNDTNYVLAMIELASVYSQAGKDSMTIVLCDEMLKEKTRYATQFLIAKGNAYDNLKKNDLASKAYDDAEKLYPGDYLIHFNRGIMLLQAEKWEEAEKYFQKALKINPYHTSSLVRLAQVNIKLGRVSQAMMCLQFYLLIDVSSDRAKQVVIMLESLVKGELNDEMTAKKPYGDTDDFSDLDELIKSKAALKDGYKAKTKLKFAMTKQVQAFLEKVRYSKANAGFYSEFFARFFEELNKNDFTVPYIYTMLSGMGLDDVNKWIKSNESKIKKFIGWAIPYIQKNHATYEDDLDGKRVTVTHYFNDGVLRAIGNKDDMGRNTGYWKYYQNMYTLQSEGNFVEDKKEGVWKFYHKNGVLKELSHYSKGMYQGEVVEYHELGTPSVKANYEANVPQGHALIYDISGARINEFDLEKGIKTGKQKTYYSSGGIMSEASYVNGKAEGTYTRYYESGNLREEGNLVSDLKNGTIVSYHDAPGKPVEFRGAYKNDEPVGEWKYYDEKGNITSEGVFDERGKKNGKWKSYHSNGKISSEYEYSKGEIDGLYNVYDSTGTLYAAYTYKSGQLKEYTFTIGGKVIQTAKESGREIPLNDYYFNGNLRKKGKYVSGKEEGKWEDYNFNGYKSAEYNYKAGVLQGDYTEYHHNGTVKLSVSYTDGQPDGYCKKYYFNGKLSEEGWFVDGKRQGNWITYYADGTLKGQFYYLNDELYGWQKYYAVNGKILYEEKYDYSQFVATKYFDTTGVELGRQYLDKGDGTIKGMNVLGKQRSVMNYKGGSAEGNFEWDFPNGVAESKGPYHSDQRHGAFEEHYPDGTKRAETNYSFGKLNGPYKIYYPSGKVKEEGVYKNGQREGVYKTFHENGQVFRNEYHKNGSMVSVKIYDELGQQILDRKYLGDYLVSYKAYTADQKETETAVKNETIKMTAYFPNKMKSIECEYKNGYLVGKRITYHSTGKMFEEEVFENGEEEGVSKTYYSTGKLMTEANYYMGYYNGNVTRYYPNGKVRSREIYRMGDLHGVCTYYNDKGELIATRTYYSDQLIDEKK